MPRMKISPCQGYEDAADHCFSQVRISFHAEIQSPQAAYDKAWLLLNPNTFVGLSSVVKNCLAAGSTSLGDVTQNTASEYVRVNVGDHSR